MKQKPKFYFILLCIWRESHLQLLFKDKLSIYGRRNQSKVIIHIKMQIYNFILIITKTSNTSFSDSY